MHIYTLRRDVAVGADLSKTWSFLSDPRNLNALTPPDLQFSIVSDLPDLMYDGLLIEYRIRLPMIGTKCWITEIKHVQEGRLFVDEQRVGPYALWYHTHRISPAGNGTLISDEVRYAMPYSHLGRLVHLLYVHKALREIFDYRESRIRALLGAPGNT